MRPDRPSYFVAGTLLAIGTAFGLLLHFPKVARAQLGASPASLTSRDQQFESLGAKSISSSGRPTF